MINRPEVRNALNKETMDEIVDALKKQAQNEETGCIIFTGKGDKSFAAGADIKQLREKKAHDAFSPNSMQHVSDIIECK